MKKFSKKFKSTGTIFTLVAIAPITALAVSCGTSELVTGTGSSSVFPIIEALSEDNDISYTATGSGAGFKSQSGKKPTHDFSMMSSKKKQADTTSAIGQWINPNIRTVTFATDAIGIALHLPKEFKIKNGSIPIISGKALARLYDTDTKKDPTWGTLITNETTNTLGSGETPKVLGRIGGKESSGTADGFFHTLKNFAAGLELDKTHSLLPKAQQTKEANSAAASVLNDKVGSLAYLSLGYAINEAKNSKSNIVIANILNDAISTSIIWNAEDIDSYGWKRPFNIAYDATNTTAIKFVKLLLDKDTQDLIHNKLGYVKLTSSQIERQIKTYKLKPISLKTTDKEIHKLTTFNNRNEIDSLYFGLNL